MALLANSPGALIICSRGAQLLLQTPALRASVRNSMPWRASSSGTGTGNKKFLNETEWKTGYGTSYRGKAPNITFWPKGFVDALTPFELKEARESGELEHKRFQSFKSAPNDATCSIFTSDPMLQKLRMLMMRQGNKERVDRALRETFAKIKENQLKKYYQATSDEQRDMIALDPIKILNEAVENVRPLMGLEQAKVGGVVYTVPTPITYERSVFEALRWLIAEAHERGHKWDRWMYRFPAKMGDILVESAAYAGKVIAKKHEHHRVCEQNRAYAHYRRSQ